VRYVADPNRPGATDEKRDDSDPLSRSTGLDERCSHLAQRLQEAFGSVIDTYIDDDMDAARARLQSMTPIKKPEELGLIADKLSFPFEDYGVIDVAERNLETAGIRPKAYREKSTAAL